MFRIKTRFSVANLNDRRLSRDIDTIVLEVLKDAAREYIKVALEIIPVWSAASHHTLSALADDAGVAIKTVPRASSPSGRKIPDRRALGRSTAGGGVTKLGSEFKMEYSTTLDYLIKNELGIADIVTPYLLKEIPYNFRASAEAAAFNYAVRELDRQLPAILADNITVRRL